MTDPIVDGNTSSIGKQRVFCIYSKGTFQPLLFWRIWNHNVVGRKPLWLTGDISFLVTNHSRTSTNHIINSRGGKEKTLMLLMGVYLCSRDTCLTNPLSHWTRLIWPEASTHGHEPCAAHPLLSQHTWMCDKRGTAISIQSCRWTTPTV